VVVTAETAPGRWIVLDPDYGVTIPMSLDEVRGHSEAVVARAYGAEYGSSVVARLTAVYRGPYRLAARGSREAMRGALEVLAFRLKWALPILFAGVGCFLMFAR
jgi:hypothetical protein